MSGCRDVPGAEGRGLIMSIERGWPNKSPEQTGRWRLQFRYRGSRREQAVAQLSTISGGQARPRLSVATTAAHPARDGDCETIWAETPSAARS